MIDIPASSVAFASLPKPPEGMQVSHVDVVIRVRHAPLPVDAVDLRDATAADDGLLD